MVTFWLLNSVSRDIGDSVIYSKIARDLWMSLEHIFGQTSEAKLFQLSHTRPDLSFAVLFLSKFMQNPTVDHQSAMLKVLRYLRLNSTQRILLSGDPSFDLLAFYDADWASQLVRLLEDMSVLPTLPVSVHSYSQATVHITKNLIFHERTKHVELDFHFVRQQYLYGLTTLSFVPSQHQLADIFTKALSGAPHRDLLCKLGVFIHPL